MRVVLIAAVARNGVIGMEGKLPWHISADLRRFKDLTMGWPVIMGRKTFDEIAERLGHALTGRYNIVLSLSSYVTYRGIEPHEVVIGPEAALEAAKRLGASAVFVIGGESVYKQFLPFADEIDLTHVNQDFEGDAFFPVLPAGDWAQVSFEPQPKKENEPLYGFAVYRRMKEPVRIGS